MKKYIAMVVVLGFSAVANAKTQTKNEFIFKKTEEKSSNVKVDKNNENELVAHTNIWRNLEKKIIDKNISMAFVHQAFSEKAFGSMNGMKVAGEFEFSYDTLKKIDSRLSSTLTPYFLYTSNKNEENFLDVIPVQTKSSYWELGLAKSLMMKLETNGYQFLPYVSLGLGVAKYNAEVTALGQSFTENVTGIATTLEAGLKTEINKQFSTFVSLGQTFFKGNSDNFSSNNLSSTKLALGVNYHY